jgi:dimethyl-sulfide monooxygenase
VHKINHHGKYFDVDGPHMCEPSPQRVPFLIQAGSSPRGIEFGTRHAEAQFVVFQNPDRAAEGARAVRDGAVAAGRAPDSVKLMQAIGVIVAETEAEVRLKHERYLANASVEGQLALFGGWTGVDLSGFKPEDELGAFDSDGMQFLAGFFGSIDADKKWTFADMCEYMKITSISPTIIGTPAQVTDELERWADEGDIDGFNLVPIEQPGTVTDFVDLVVPELQARGRARTAYDSTTLRENFAGRGHTYLPQDHPVYAVSRDN